MKHTIRLSNAAACLVLCAALLLNCSDNSNNPVLDDGQDKNAPATPTGLTFLKVDNGEITLTWDANTETDLAGYRLYRAEDYDVLQNFRVVYEGDSTNYTDSNLNYSTTYIYKIAAFDISDNESQMSDGLVGMPANTRAPLRPENLQVGANNIQYQNTPFIDIRWDHNNEPDLGGYMIYRGSSAGSVTAFIDSTKNNFYEDFDIQVDSTYYYRVSAYDRGGLESPKSDVDSDVALRKPTLVAPVNPDLAPALPTFTWNRVDKAVKYRIFLLRTSQADEIWNVTVNAPDTSIVYDGNTTLQSGTQYWWKVATITKSSVGLNSISETASFRIQ